MLFSIMVTAQDRDSNREKIRALKTAYITEGLNLTSQEAQQFWPIYNEYEQTRRRLYWRERADVESTECLNEEQAEAQLNEYVEIERQDYLLRKKYYNDLKKIFSARRIIQLKEVENEFDEKMMREFRERRSESTR